MLFLQPDDYKSSSSTLASDGWVDPYEKEFREKLNIEMESPNRKSKKPKQQEVNRSHDMSRDRKQEVNRSHDRKEAQQGIPLVQQQSDATSQQTSAHSSPPLQQSDNPVQYSNNNPHQSHTPGVLDHPRAPAPAPAPGPRPPYQYNYQRPNIYTNPHPAPSLPKNSDHGAPLLPRATHPGVSLLPLATEPSIGMYGYRPRYIKKRDYKKYGHEIYGNERKVNQFNSNSLPNQLHRRSTDPSNRFKMSGSSHGYQMPPDGQYPIQPPDGQYPAQPPDGKYPAQPPDGQYPTQPPDGQYPTQPPDGQCPAQPPDGQYPAQPPDSQYPTQCPSKPDPFPDIPYIDHGSNQSLNQNQNEAVRQPNRGYTEYYDWTEHNNANGFHNNRNNPRYGYGSHPILYHSDYQDNVAVPQYGASNYHQGVQNELPHNNPPQQNPPRHDSSDLGFYDLSYTSLPTSDLGLLNSAPTLNPSRQYRDASYRNSAQRSRSHGHLEDDTTPGSQMTYLSDHPGDHPGASNKGWSTLPRNFSHNQDNHNVPGLQDKQDCHSDGDESQKAFYVLAKPKSEKSQPIDTGSNAYFLSRV